MDYASSILVSYCGRRSTGISQLLDKLEAYLSPLKSNASRGLRLRRGKTPGSKAPFGRTLHHPSGGRRGHPRRSAAGRRYLVAAILHDVIEDTPTAKAEIARFSARSWLNSSTGSANSTDTVQKRQEAQAESFRKMLLAMVRDIRVIMVKLAIACTTCAPSA